MISSCNDKVEKVDKHKNHKNKMFIKVQKFLVLSFLSHRGMFSLALNNPENIMKPYNSLKYCCCFLITDGLSIFL